MQRTRLSLQGPGKGEVVRVAVGIVLLVLLIGLWVYLWVPLSPVR